jgi:hypothetical protein
MSAPKDHYLPKFYLRGFADGERLQIFDRERKEFRTQTVLNTANERNRYTVILPDGTQDRTIEQVVLNRVETTSAAAIRKLGKKEPLTVWEREALCWLGAFFHSRVPDFEDSLSRFYDEVLKDAVQLLLSSPAQTEKILRQIDPGWDRSRVSPEDIFKLVQERAYTIKFHRNEYIRSMIKMATDVVKYLIQMDWTILHSPPGEEEFITSDSPLFVEYPEDWKMLAFMGVGLIIPGATKYLPLSASVCLVLGDRGERFENVDISPAEVQKINEAIGWNSYKMVIGKSESLLRSVVEATGIESIPPSAGIRITRFGPYLAISRGRPKRPPKRPRE